MSFIINHSGRDKRDVRRAEKLTKALSRKSRLMKPPSQQSWIMEFKHLRESGVKVSRVLNWYCKHIGEEGVPDVRSAGGFRKRFRDLEKAMEKTRGESNGVRVQKDVRQFVRDYLADERWPQDSYERLPAAVQVSADNHAIMVDRLETYVARWDDVPEHKWPGQVSLAFSILAEHQETFTFIHNWFTWVHGQVRRWDNWNGSFRQFIFRPEHKRFSNLMYYEAMTHGDPEYWNMLLKEVQ